jgi:hypothetical protein
MQTSQQILDDVNLRYRNTFTTNQILVWFNEEQRELFDVLELDSAPYNFKTVVDENYYPFPVDFDVTKIKVVTYQIDDSTTPNYIEIPFERNDDRQYASYGLPWWAIVSDAFYLNVEPSVPDARNVYIYTDADPTEVTTSNLSVAPDLPTKYQEILKLGVLKRIALARKDLTMGQTYDSLYQEKLNDVLWQRKLAEPEWVSPIDTLPRASRGRYNERVPIVITQME